MIPPRPGQTVRFYALENALRLDTLGYVCTPTTTLDTTVTECLPVVEPDGRPRRDRKGSVVKSWQRVEKRAKTAIGVWKDAQAGSTVTKARFEKQLWRVTKSALEFGVNQDAGNLGVAIDTAKSGVVVLDIDAGKVPDPSSPTSMMDADVAHDILISNLLRAADITSKDDLAAWISWIKSLIYVRTPSGGRHYYFRRMKDQKPRMHTGCVDYVDIRAGFQEVDGTFRSSSLAYAPGNVTSRGRYAVYQNDASGVPVEVDMLPSVHDLPALPNEICWLLEKSTTEIRSIACSKGISAAEFSAFKSKKVKEHRDVKKLGSTTRTAPTPYNAKKWDQLAEQFVRAAQAPHESVNG